MVTRIDVLCLVVDVLILGIQAVRVGVDLQVGDGDLPQLTNQPTGQSFQLFAGTSTRRQLTETDGA